MAETSSYYEDPFWGPQSSSQDVLVLDRARSPVTSSLRYIF
jgi:hypothetical protein